MLPGNLEVAPASLFICLRNSESLPPRAIAMATVATPVARPKMLQLDLRKFLLGAPPGLSGITLLSL
jgi:hypothetical protein